MGSTGATELQEKLNHYLDMILSYRTNNWYFHSLWLEQPINTRFDTVCCKSDKSWHNWFHAGGFPNTDIFIYC